MRPRANRYLLTLGTIVLVAAVWNLYVARHAHGIVAGRVVGPDGRPAAGVTVTLFERTLTTLERRATARTEQDGRFRFSDQRSHHLVLQARQDGAGASPRTTVRLYFRGQDVVLAEPLRLGTGEGE